MMDENTNDTISKDGYPLPILIYGRPTCEDTAAVRERLDELGVSFVEIDVDSDMDAAEFVEKVSRGNRTTPTIVFGNHEFLLVEPISDELDNALRRAGYKVDSHEMDNV